MYCKKCGKEIPDDSIFCNHCGTNQKETSSADSKQEKKPDELATVSVNTGCLRTISIWIGGIVAVVAIVVCCCLFIPLDNDKECYQAGKEAHEALNALKIYGQKYECSSSCPICHPVTWRWEVKKMRMGVK